jgi:hypothetical protein
MLVSIGSDMKKVCCGRARFAAFRQRAATHYVPRAQKENENPNGLSSRRPWRRLPPGWFSQ